MTEPRQAQLALNSLEKKLFRRLLRQGHLEEKQAFAAADAANKAGRSFAEHLVREGLVGEKVVARGLARVHGFDFLDLDDFEPPQEVRELLPARVVRRCRALPVAIVDDALVVAMGDAGDVLAQDEVRAIAARPVRTVISTPRSLNAAIDRYYPGTRGEEFSSAEEVPTFHGAETGFAEETDSDKFANAETINEDEGRTTFHQQETRIEQPGETPPETEPKTIGPGEAPRAGRHSRVVEMDDLRERLEREMAEAKTQIERSDTWHSTTGSRARESRHENWSREDELPVDEKTGAAAVELILGEMLDAALAARAEEVEFPAPGGKASRTRIRRDGIWLPSTPYPVKYHEALMKHIREIAGIENSDHAAVESHFVLEGRTGEIPVVACFTPTIRGERCVLRFPENVPILQHPLRILQIPKKEADRIRARLSGEGGGLLLLTSDQPRSAGQLYTSLLFQSAGEGRSVTSLHWTADRQIPGVSQIECQDEEELHKSLNVVVAEEPDLIGLSAVPDSSLLREVFAIAMKGRSVLACMTLPASGHAQAVLRAGGVDPMHVTAGLIAHVHVTREPRLCPDCCGMIDGRVRTLPEWAKDVDPTRFFEAGGCEACSGTGRKGAAWVPEVFVADEKGSGELVALRTREESLRALVEEGLLDIREVR